MTKWHLNTATGDYNKCGAKPGNCPLGGDNGTDNHFQTKKEAQQASEKLLEKEFGKFSTNPRIVKDQQTQQLKTLYKISLQLDDDGYRSIKDYSNLVVRHMVEGKPQKAKQYMDEIVEDMSRKSTEHSSVLDTDWKNGFDNLPESIEEDKKDIVSQRLRLLYEASDYFDDDGIDIANDASASIILSGGPFNKDKEKEVNRDIYEFASVLSTRANEVEWFHEKSEEKFNNIMNEYYSINNY